jgi:hypothetical protein
MCVGHIEGVLTAYLIRLYRAIKSLLRPIFCTHLNPHDVLKDDNRKRGAGASLSSS